MWLFRREPTPPPSPSPDYDIPWRFMDLKKDRANLLTTINNFQTGNPEVNTLRFLLYGPVGAGKSSFFKSVNNVLQGRITTRAQAHSIQTNRSFTLECETYKLRKDRPGSFFPFTFTDIAGMHDHESGSIKTDDIIKLLNGHIHDGYTFNPFKAITAEDPKYKRNPTLKDRIHCLVAVIPANTVSMMAEDIFKEMKEVREEARNLGIPQVIVMTKVDELCPLVKDKIENIYKIKKIKHKMEECSNKLGVTMDCIYPVKNYHEEHATDEKMDILILDALQHIVNFANDHVEDQIEREQEAHKST